MRIALIWKNKENLQTFKQYEIAEKVYRLGYHLHGPKKCIAWGPMYRLGLYRLRFRDCIKKTMNVTGKDIEKLIT